MSLKIDRYLVVNARGTTRLTTRWPNLHWDEVAIPITVTIPDTWGKVYQALAVEVTLPADAAPTLTVATEDLVRPDASDAPGSDEQ